MNLKPDVQDHTLKTFVISPLFHIYQKEKIELEIAGKMALKVSNNLSAQFRTANIDFVKSLIILVCSDNKYGRNCALDCQCHLKNTVLCDPVSGNCSCKPGWTGQDCTEGK